MRAFLKKEWMETVRTGRGLILLLIFVLFGIMNPAFAKFTPWMMQVMSESLEEAGLIIEAVNVDAMTSWTQFYKNIPLALIIFVLLESGNFTSEYQRGTLIPAVTKGLSRKKILAAKTIMMASLWTIGYFLCYGITFSYNAYFWDNSIASHCFFGAVCYWLFGLWVIGFMILFSAISGNNTQVLLGTGAAAVGAYLLGLFPKFSVWTPARLMDGMSLLQGIVGPGDYLAGILVSFVLFILCLLLSAAGFDRKKL